MSTLAEIEAAANALPSQQQEELFLYLAARLRAGVGQLPPPREFRREQIQAWIADDEAVMRRFREGVKIIAPRTLSLARIAGARHLAVTG